MAQNVPRKRLNQKELKDLLGEEGNSVCFDCSKPFHIVSEV
jgi:hypothetical protein